MIMPNFFIIGVEKSGTSSLWHYLNQHPEIFLPRLKEPRFFCFEGDTLNFRGPADQKHANKSITKLEDYLALFRDVKNEKAIGEASVFYFYSQKAMERIKHYAPQAKLIVGLRSPADRAYSSYLMHLRLGFEPITSFDRALKEEEARLRNNWFQGRYASMGFYYQNLKRYIETFSRDQVEIFLTEDFNVDTVGITQKMFRFLDVDDTFTPDVSKRVNTNERISLHRSRALDSFTKQPNLIKSIGSFMAPKYVRDRLRWRLQAWNALPRPAFRAETRQRLIELYREDILRTQDLIGRDLTHWLE